MIEISAEHYRDLFYETRNKTAFSHRLDMLGQPPADAVYAKVAGYAFWYKVRDGGDFELGGVFKTQLGFYCGGSRILSGLRIKGARTVSIDAFQCVADKVWKPLGFVEWNRVDFDWKHAPLHMHSRRNPKPGPIIYMTKVL